MTPSSTSRPGSSNEPTTLGPSGPSTLTLARLTLLTTARTAVDPAAHGSIGAVRVLSVDLGTSNTVAVLSVPGLPPRLVEIEGSATMPSAVFALDDGRFAVGRDAQRRARLDPDRYEPNPKRRIDEGSLPLGGVVVPVTEALAAVLRRVAGEAARLPGGDRLDEVRLTHPWRWGPVQRGVLLGAAHRVAGFAGRVILIPEPLAAAAHFAMAPGCSSRPGHA
ncbi:MAG TPA: hypothetical protein VKA75_19185, partial [Reyranella sp.]|nr:hypothetical protein [Reyranella sp.]